MSNYPPGVTGHEPAIAGVREIEVEFTCSEIMTVATVYDTLEHPDGDSVIAIYQTREMPCWFSGTADGYQSPFGGFYVECPVCGIEIELEPKERDDY